jgi:glycosyltransferase involved in cell wall biosynthesis
VEWGLDDQFVVQYAGLIGMAQGLEAVLDTAHLLLDRKEIVFVFVGEGIEKDGLVRRAASMGLTNVRFVPGQPPDRVPDLMSAADVGLALKKKMALNQGAIPVKMFEYMACRRPVIVGGAAEAEAILKEADAGICVDPTEPKEVARAILDLYADRSRAARLGENGRDFVKRHFSRKGLSDRYLAGLQDLVSDPAGSPKEKVRP